MAQAARPGETMSKILPTVRPYGSTLPFNHRLLVTPHHPQSEELAVLAVLAVLAS